MPGVKRPDTFPDTLPCGCKLKNRQGAWIAGKFAPTQRRADGLRVCRHGRVWKPTCEFVEVR